jgi:hypothetical protein
MSVSVAPEVLHKLYSTAIPESSDGHYDYHLRVYLTSHELFRRDLMRTERALEVFEPLKHRWQLDYMIKWFEDYLLPVLHLHEESEEKASYPHFKTVGIDIPKELGEEHAHADEMFLIIRHHLDEIQEAFDPLTQSRSPRSVSTMQAKELKDQITAFKKDFKHLKEHLLEHYAEEEAFWPGVVSQVGQDVHLAAQAKAHRSSITNNKASGNLYFAGIFDAMGYEGRGGSYMRPVTDDPLDIPWCGAKMRQEVIYGHQNYKNRAFPLPAWSEDYQHYKRMINSVAVGEDYMLIGREVMKKDPQFLLSDSYACHCVVS